MVLHLDKRVNHVPEPYRQFVTGPMAALTPA